MRWQKKILASCVLAGLACSHAAGPPLVPPMPDRPTPPKGIRLAVLPVESDGFPEVAEWVSNLLADVRVSGVDEYFKTRGALGAVPPPTEGVDSTAQCDAQGGKPRA